MIVVFAPEPCHWLLPLSELLASTAPVKVWAPWATDWPEFVCRRSLFFRRRKAVKSELRIPGWFLIEAASRLYERGRTDRRLSSFFTARRLLDQLSASRLPKSCRLVVAPSGGARFLFAKARRHGSQTLLIQDVPLLRQLHFDLDSAIEKHPRCAFLGRYRATHSVLTRQEAEWVLSDGVLHFSRWSVEQFHGAPSTPHMMPLHSEQHLESAATALSPQILLAGKACGRTGIMEALDALEERPDWTLLIQPGEGLEPSGVLSHPQVRFFQKGDPISAVVAPAWAELRAPEVLWAALNGIPVVATSQAAGIVDLALHGRQVEAGDAVGLRIALDGLLKAKTPAMNIKDLQTKAQTRLLEWVSKCVSR